MGWKQDLRSAQALQFVQNKAIAGCQTNLENKTMNQTRGKSEKVWLVVQAIKIYIKVSQLHN